MSGATALVRRRCCCGEPVRTVYRLDPCIATGDDCEDCGSGTTPKHITLVFSGMTAPSAYESLYWGMKTCGTAEECPNYQWGEVESLVGFGNGAITLQQDSVDPCKWEWVGGSASVRAGQSYDSDKWAPGAVSTADNIRVQLTISSGNNVTITAECIDITAGWSDPINMCDCPTGDPEYDTAQEEHYSSITVRAGMFSAQQSINDANPCIDNLDELELTNTYTSSDPIQISGTPKDEDSWYAKGLALRPAHSGKVTIYPGVADGQRCPGGDPVYTDDDLSAYVGYVVLIEGVCYEVSVAPPGEYALVSVTVTQAYLDCDACCDAA